MKTTKRLKEEGKDFGWLDWEMAHFDSDIIKIKNLNYFDVKIFGS